MEIVEAERPLEPWELAIKLDVLLCFPRETDDRRERLRNMIGGKRVRLSRDHARQTSPDTASDHELTLSNTFPEYNRDAWRRTSIMLNRNRIRAQHCGSVILVLIQKAATGHFPRFTGEDRQPTLEEVARYLLQVEGRGVDANGNDGVHQFLKADVRPWYPVAHLAAAFQRAARILSRDAPSATFDYDNRRLFCLILRRAEQMAEYIRATESLKGMASKLVPLSEFDGLRG